MAYSHSGYPGGLRAVAYKELLESQPDKAVEKAIKGMVPHNTLGRQMLSKLKVYAGPDAPAPGPAAGAVRDHPGRAVARAPHHRTSDARTRSSERLWQ